MQLFAKRDRSSLRQHLNQLNASAKLGKVSKEAATQQSVEILTALKKLGDPISPQEEEFLNSNKSKAMSEFETAANDLGQKAKQNILSSAAKDVKK